MEFLAYRSVGALLLKTMPVKHTFVMQLTLVLRSFHQQVILPVCQSQFGNIIKTDSLLTSESQIANILKSLRDLKSA